MRNGAQCVFVVGSPRSGTTWMQKLLACRDDVVTGQETGLFDTYVGPMLRAFERDLDPAVTGRSPLGLGCYMTREAFETQLRQFLDAALEHVFRDVPREALFVEKTPSHALYIPEIQSFLAESRFIHVVRDGRDVVASLLAASRTWGSQWAPSDAVAAARMWAAHVRTARRDGSALGPSRYLEIHYEHLRSDPQGVLGGMVAPFLGFQWGKDEIAKALEWTSPEVQRAGKGLILPLGGEAARWYGVTAKEPEGFIRSAGKRSWRDELGLIQRLRVWHLIRGTLRDFGYAWPLPW